jgi:hypothetical protein
MEITKSEYIKLKVSEAKLNELEINGVDNWKNYGCMCNYLCEEEWDGECIFCTALWFNTSHLFLPKAVISENILRPSEFPQTILFLPAQFVNRHPKKASNACDHCS